MAGKYYAIWYVWGRTKGWIALILTSDRSEIIRDDEWSVATQVISLPSEVNIRAQCQAPFASGQRTRGAQRYALYVVVCTRLKHQHTFTSKFWCKKYSELEGFNCTRPMCVRSQQTSLISQALLTQNLLNLSTTSSCSSCRMFEAWK